MTAAHMPTNGRWEGGLDDILRERMTVRDDVYSLGVGDQRL